MFPPQNVKDFNSYKKLNPVDKTYTNSHTITLFLKKHALFKDREKKTHLVGGFNPVQKYYCSQIGSFPQVGVK